MAAVEMEDESNIVDIVVKNEQESDEGKEVVDCPNNEKKSDAQVTVIKSEPDFPPFVGDEDDFINNEECEEQLSHNSAISIEEHTSDVQSYNETVESPPVRLTYREALGMRDDPAFARFMYREPFTVGHLPLRGRPPLIREPIIQDESSEVLTYNEEDQRFTYKESYYNLHPEGKLTCKDCSSCLGTTAVNPNEPYNCHNCGKFVSLDGTINERNHFPCNVCGKVFLYRSRLRLHMVSHSEVKPFTCLVCGKGFAHRYNFDNHMTIHSGDLRYACQICGRAFPHVGALNRHMAEHSGDWPYKCDVCGKGFSWDSRLKEHLISHTKEKPYKCEICGKGFSWEGRLKNHLASHSEEKPFKCDICGKGFSWVSRLKNHLVSHSEEKPFKCEVCGKGYSWQSSLKDHMISHTMPGEKRFKCEICSKGYAWHSSLKDHMMIHTGEKIDRSKPSEPPPLIESMEEQIG